jgi:hypothetical protein
MRNNNQWVAAAARVASLLLLRNKATAGPAASLPASTLVVPPDMRASFLGMSDLPRGIRNNNPGNIKKNPANNWQGQITNGTDSTFVQFQYFAFGVRAMLVLLRNYIAGGHNTIEKIINRWAPAGVDNNPTSSYVAQVAFSTGINPRAPISFANKEQIRKIAKAIADYENGKSNVISNSIFDYAYSIV